MQPEHVQSLRPIECNGLAQIWRSRAKAPRDRPDRCQASMRVRPHTAGLSIRARIMLVGWVCMRLPKSAILSMWISVLSYTCLNGHGVGVRPGKQKPHGLHRGVRLIMSQETRTPRSTSGNAPRGSGARRRLVPSAAQGFPDPTYPGEGHVPRSPVRALVVTTSPGMPSVLARRCP